MKINFKINKISSIPYLASLLFSALLIINTPIQAAQKAKTSPFVGEWNWEEKGDPNDHGTPDDDPAANIHTFSLSIKTQNNKIVGSYDCVTPYGRIIDSTPDNESSFSVPLPNGNSFSTNFKTAYSASVGKVKITVAGNKLHWEVIKEPSGNFYCPSKALLIIKDN